MFRSNRRKKKEINIEAMKELLKTERRAVLAVNGDDGYPYAVPLNYLYLEEEEKIIFHGAKVGHKFDSISKCDKVCFTVYGNERIIKEEWAPFMQSVVVFGRCRILNEQEEILKRVKQLAGKYYPTEELIDHEISQDGHRVQMFEITIEHMTGKEIQEI